MKKGFLLTLLLLVGILVSSPASAFILTLEDWKFDPSAVDGSLPSLFSPIDEITFLGGTFINQDGVGGPGAAFSDKGFFYSTGFQNDLAPVFGTGLNSDYQITGVFESAGHNTTLVGTDQNFVFTSATLDLYLDTALNYGTSDAYFGASDGTKIASFELLFGGGDFDFATNQLDGQIDIHWTATELMAGVWFDKNNIDLSTMVANSLVGAFTNSNNNLLANPPPMLMSEIAEAFTDGTPDSLGDFYTANDGSFNPTVVPEPASLALMGIGLLGLAGVARRKFRK